MARRLRRALHSKGHRGGAYPIRCVRFCGCLPWEGSRCRPDKEGHGSGEGGQRCRIAATHKFIFDSSSKPPCSIFSQGDGHTNPPSTVILPIHLTIGATPFNLEVLNFPSPFWRLHFLLCFRLSSALGNGVTCVEDVAEAITIDHLGAPDKQDVDVDVFLTSKDAEGRLLVAGSGTRLSLNAEGGHYRERRTSHSDWATWRPEEADERGWNKVAWGLTAAAVVLGASQGLVEKVEHDEEGERPSISFGLVRFLTTLGVLYSHSFSFSGFQDPFKLFWGDLFVSLGTLCVTASFIISGFGSRLSLQRRTAGAFLSRRCRLLFPPLITFALLSPLVLTFFSNVEMPLQETLHRSSTYAFFIETALAPLSSILPLRPWAACFPGIFCRSREWPINTPLYTLAPLFRCYLMISAMRSIQAFDVWTAGVVAVAQLSAGEGAVGHFFLGVCLSYLPQEEILSRQSLLLCMAVATVAVRDKDVFRLLAPVVISWLVMAIAVGARKLDQHLEMSSSGGSVKRAALKILRVGDRLGGVVYYVYIWGGPVQKAIIERGGWWRAERAVVFPLGGAAMTEASLIVPSMSPGLNFVISSIVVFRGHGS